MDRLPILERKSGTEPEWFSLNCSLALRIERSCCAGEYLSYFLDFVCSHNILGLNPATSDNKPPSLLGFFAEHTSL